MHISSLSENLSAGNTHYVYDGFDILSLLLRLSAA